MIIVRFWSRIWETRKLGAFRSWCTQVYNSHSNGDYESNDNPNGVCIIWNKQKQL
jgi:hypothetical protein